MKYYITLCILILPFVLRSQSLEWVKAFGGASEDFGQSLCLDASGNILVTGHYRQIIDFMPKGVSSPLTSNGSLDVFVVNMDTEGNVIWAKAFGGTDLDRVDDICSDDDGNIYLTGQYNGTVDFDPGPGVSELTSNGNFDVYILKLDTSGTFVWAVSFGGAGPDQAHEIVIDNNGNVTTVGQFNNTVDFDPGLSLDNLSSKGQGDIFIHHLTSLGEYLWVKTYGSSNNDDATTINIDLNGNFLIGGWYRNTINFDPDGSEAGSISSISANWDAFILKLDFQGNFIWVKSFGGEDLDRIYALTSDLAGNVIATGFFEGTSDFDPGPGTANLTSAVNSDDTFVVKLNESGEYQWAKSFKGGPQNNYGNAIAVDDQANVYTAGEFIGTVDFDPSNGGRVDRTSSFSNLFIHKMDGEGNFRWVSTTQGSGDDIAKSLVISNSGEIFVTGEFKNMVDFDEGPDINEPGYQGEEDIFILKLSSQTTGLNPPGHNFEVRAYPNPTPGLLKLQFDSPIHQVTIELTDILGQKVWEQSHDVMENHSFELGTSAGIYFLHIESVEGRRVLKLVRQ